MTTVGDVSSVSRLDIRGSMTRLRKHHLVRDMMVNMSRHKSGQERLE